VNVYRCDLVGSDGSCVLHCFIPPTSFEYRIIRFLPFWFLFRVSTSSLPCRRFSLCLSFSWSWKFGLDINGKVEEEEAEEEKKKSGDIEEKVTQMGQEEAPDFITAERTFHQCQAPDGDRKSD